MSFLGRDGEHQLVFYIIVIFFSTISSLCSLLNIYLIHDMKIWNGHVKLIYSMAWSQFIYDISFAPGVITLPTEGVAIFANVLQLMGGLSVAVFSNIMSIVVLYVIKFRVSIDIMKHYKWYCFGIAIVLVAEIILYLLSELNPSYDYLGDIALLGIYYYFRLASIGLNFIACGLSYLYVWRIESMIVGKKTIQEEAICLLSTRMQYYPLVQAISRAGLSWYEFVYGWDFDPDAVTTNQFICQILSACTTPAASIGYFAIMVIMQPKAYQTIRSWFTRPSTSTSSSSSTKDGANEEYKSDNNNMSFVEYNRSMTGGGFANELARNTMAAFNEEELCQIIDCDYIDRDYSFTHNSMYQNHEANMTIFRPTNRGSQVHTPIHAAARDHQQNDL